MGSPERTLVAADHVFDAPGSGSVRPAGGADAFSAFFETHHGAVSAYLRRRAPVDVADELAVGTFEVAWHRWQEVPQDRPLPWLYGVARRLLANERRGDERRGRLRLRLAGGAGGGRSAHRSAEPTAGTDPATAAVDAMAARHALERLRPDDREALMLVAWEGLDAAAAAASLGLTTAAFTVRLHRARQRLEKLLPSTPTAKD
jgi:RNA polymerase sigma-70 factor (ECF subfamily)